MKSWNATTRAGTPFTLTLHDDLIEWQDSEYYKAGIAEFFTKHNPFDELTLTNQVELMHALCEQVSFSNDPGEEVNALVAFWNHYPILHIEEKTFSFQTKISDVSKWKLHLSKTGLTWHDLSSHYSPTNRIIEQNLADFWFYGPVYPLPSVDMRKEIVSIIKNALTEVGYPDVDKHFPIINYPSFVMGPQWEDGDYIVSDFVIMREYGIEDGRQNFHDGLVFLNFTSFEHCLTRSDIPEYHIRNEILAEIQEMIIDANRELNPID